MSELWAKIFSAQIVLLKSSSDTVGMNRQTSAWRRGPFQFSLKAALVFTAYFALLMGIVMDFVAHRRYRAETLLASAWGLPLTEGSGNRGFDGSGQPDCPTRVRAELHQMVLESDPVLTAAAKRLQDGGRHRIDDAPSPSRWVRDRVDIAPHEAAGRIWQVVGHSHVDPQQAVDVCGAVADAYLEIQPTLESSDEDLLIEQLAQRCAREPSLSRELLGSHAPQSVSEIEQALCEASRCPELPPFGKERFVLLARTRAAVLVAPFDRLAAGLLLWAVLVLVGIVFARRRRPFGVR